jgi:hypothetical protein
MKPNLPSEPRELKHQGLCTDLVVVGGGVAGVCCAIAAARSGIRVVLIQDRPVLGGNASSEVRLWILGATSHMGNNNRWAREGGVIDEILVENTFRNPEGNPVICDTILLDKVVSEPNITLLLDTVCFEVSKHDDSTLASVRAFSSLDETLYDISAALFADCSGDGVLGFLAGAAFRVGQEARSEFDELYAPEKYSTDHLGHTIYFMSKDLGRPVNYTAPSFALGMDKVANIHRYRSFDAKSQAANFWWIEYGGHLDTIHDSREIKWELWKVAYGVWNYIKNSGKFPEAANLTLEWVGPIPGKRESRRFEGDVIMTQQDLIEQKTFPDAVSFGGWAIDHHPVDGVYSEKPGCTQWHSKGVYQIPYRSLYSRNISNLFLGGRLISVSHIAFGSTRVMGTAAHNGQAIGKAAALCIRHKLKPRDLTEPKNMLELQQLLLRSGQYIPKVKLVDSEDLATSAKITASSSLVLGSLPADGGGLTLQDAWAMLLPLDAGKCPEFTIFCDVAKTTQLQAELRSSQRCDNHTPDLTLATLKLDLHAGQGQRVTLRFDANLPQAAYTFVCLLTNPDITVRLSEQRVTGVLAVTQKFNRAVAKSPRQEPPVGSGIDSFEFWIPLRRPMGQNIALEISPAINCFRPENSANGWGRPISAPNAWVAAVNDKAPKIELSWPTSQTIAQVDLGFDTDYDHPMESIIMGHPESAMPFCIKHYRLVAGNGKVIAEISDNHQSQRSHVLEIPLQTDKLTLECLESHGNVPAAIFQIRCYSEIKS